MALEKAGIEVSYEPIPPDMLAECRRLVRIHHGSGMSSADAMLLASVFARGMQHARKLDKEDRDAYEAERAEWEAERAEQEAHPLIVDVDIRMSDQAVEEMRARLMAAMKQGKVQILSEPVTYEPIRKIKQEAAQKERDEIAAHVNEELNKTHRNLDGEIAVYESLIDWLDRRNDRARESSRDSDQDAVREPGRTG